MFLRVRRWLALRIHAHCVGGGARSAFSAENTVPTMRGTPYSHLTLAVNSLAHCRSNVLTSYESRTQRAP